MTRVLGSSSNCVHVVHDLESMESDVKLRAIRTMKNSVIGNRTKKNAYVELGVTPILISILNTESDPALLINAAATLGSLSKTHMNLMVQNGAIDALLNHISNPNVRVVESCCRSLRIIYENKNTPKDMLSKGNTVATLISLLSAPPPLSELAASLLATHPSPDAIAPLTSLLNTPHTKCQEAACDALASIFASRATEQFNGGVIHQILKLIRESRRNRMRLLAVKCFSYLNRIKAIVPTQEIIVSVLPVIIKLLSIQPEDPESVHEEAPAVLANLIHGNEELQKAACDANAVPKLAQYLNEQASDVIKQNVMTALTEICSIRDEGRKLVFESKPPILASIVNSLSSSNESVREAACTCTHALSRSVKHLRSALVDAGIANHLLALLEDSNTHIQTSAAATLCNLIMDFSPMKQYMIERGGVKKLVHFCIESMDSTLRVNAITALKNLSFRSDISVKETILKELTYESLFELLNDDEVEVQRHAMNIVRNLFYGPLPPQFVTRILGNGVLLNTIQTKLTQQYDVGVVLHSVFVLCNLAGLGTEEQKRSIMSAPILQTIFSLFTHENKEVRSAAVWLIINLTWDILDENDTEEKKLLWEQRMKILQEYQCKEKLEQVIRVDTELDVRERAKQAIEHMNNRGTGLTRRSTISE